MTALILKSVAIGLGTGFVSGLTGMGGGVILVPVFYFLYDLPIKHAIGTSLAVIVFTALSAFLSHAKGRQINIRLAGFIIVSGIAGAQVGALLTSRLPDVVVKTSFLCLVAGLGVRMWFDTDKGGKDVADACRRDWWKTLLIGFAGGFVSGMGGIGGAILLVPLLHLCLGVPMNICIGTTLAAVFCNALSGSIGYFGRDLVDPRIALFVAMGSVPAAPFGARLSMRLPQKTLRKIFAVVLLVAGASILVRR